MTTPSPAPTGPWAHVVNYGPLLVFFVANRFLGPIPATGVFVAAMILAALIAKVKLGRITPMLWLSLVLVVVFGGITLWLDDPAFIQLKPTIIYSIMGALLMGGWAMRRPLLRYVLESAFDGLSERGWLALSLSWGFFFLAMAGLNEVLRHRLSFDSWLTVKVWVLPVATLLFAMANLPLMTRHGFGREPPPKPPEA